MRTVLVGAAIAALLSATAARGSSSQTPTAGSASNGEALARSLGCAGCHSGVSSAQSIRDLAPALGPDAAPLAVDFIFTYLANPVLRRPEIAPARMPDFRLSEEERLALALFLGQSGGGRAPGADGPEVAAARRRHPDVGVDQGRVVFTSLGCAACHGSAEGDVVAVVSDAQVGPDLSREGVRVRPQWLQGWLLDPGPIGPAGNPPGSGRRMPDFRLADSEAADLTAYLMSLTSAVDPTSSRSGDWSPQALTPIRAQRASRLLETRVACAGCHRIGGAGGQVGPPLDGIRDRLRPAFVRDMILDPRATVPEGSMPGQSMRPQDAELIASYLLENDRPWTVPERVAVSAEGVTAMGGDIGDDIGGDIGAALYARHCASCHGREGGGDGWNAPNLPVPPTQHADSALMSRRADDTLFDGIHGGGWVLDRSPRMPAFGEFLTTDEIRAIIAHIRVLCSCTEPSWSGHGG